jgi:hypothetical protein
MGNEDLEWAQDQGYDTPEDVQAGILRCLHAQENVQNKIGMSLFIIVAELSMGAAALLSNFLTGQG